MKAIRAIWYFIYPYMTIQRLRRCYNIILVRWERATCRANGHAFGPWQKGMLWYFNGEEFRTCSQCGKVEYRK